MAIFEKTGIEGLVVIKPRVIEDKRGYFFESYNGKTFEENKLDHHFVQDNEALSSYGVIRGMHFQLEPYAQAKLVRVMHGEVQDVVVDLRKGSPTYGKSYSICLSAENKFQLLIPRGFAHGYLVLSEKAVFFYKCDAYYSKEYEGGIMFNDPALDIEWLLPEDKMIVSDRDLNHPLLENFEHNFVYKEANL